MVPQNENTVICLVDFLKIALRESIHCYVNIKCDYWHKTSVTVIVNLIFPWKKNAQECCCLRLLTIASTSLT